MLRRVKTPCANAPGVSVNKRSNALQGRRSAIFTTARGYLAAVFRDLGRQGSTVRREATIPQTVFQRNEFNVIYGKCRHFGRSSLVDIPTIIVNISAEVQGFTLPKRRLNHPLVYATPHFFGAGFHACADRTRRCFSRCHSRSLSAARLSCCFLPFARPMSSLMRPFT